MEITRNSPLEEHTSCVSTDRKEQFSLSTIREIQQLVSIEEAWKNLFKKLEIPSIALSHEWCLEWQNALTRPEYRLAITLMHNQKNELIGIIPMYIDCQRFPLPRVLRFIGSSSKNDSLCPEFVDIVGNTNELSAFREEIARYLAKLPWDLFSYDPVQTGLISAPPGLARVEHVPGYRVIIEERGFENFIKSQSADRRKRHRTMLRDAERANLTFDVATTREDLQEFLTQLMELHTKRWKEDGHEGAFGVDSVKSFHRNLLNRLIQEGSSAKPVITRLSDGDRPIAFVYGFMLGERFEAYQAAALRDGDSPVRSPGMVAHLLTIKYLAEETSIRSYDLLGGFSEYKRRLATEEYSLMKGSIVADTFTSKVRDLTQRLLAKIGH